MLLRPPVVTAKKRGNHTRTENRPTKLDRRRYTVPGIVSTRAYAGPGGVRKIKAFCNEDKPDTEKKNNNWLVPSAMDVSKWWFGNIHVYPSQWRVSNDRNCARPYIPEKEIRCVDTEFFLEPSPLILGVYLSVMVVSLHLKRCWFDTHLRHEVYDTKSTEKLWIAIVWFWQVEESHLRALCIHLQGKQRGAPEKWCQVETCQVQGRDRR